MIFMNGIYCYTDSEDNSVVYVGKDSYIHKNKRHNEHLAKSRRDEQTFNRVLQNNPDRYKYNVLIKGIFNDYELNNIEISLINAFRPKFNFTKGGDGSTGYKHTEEAKKKISERLTGRQLSHETRKRMSENHADFSGENNPNYGKPLSETTRMKLSKVKNSSGYYRVFKRKDSRYKNGFAWQYSYYDVNGKLKSIQAVSIEKLKEKVISKCLKWKKLVDDNC